MPVKRDDPLYKEAQRLNIRGRTKMDRRQLEAAIAKTGKTTQQCDRSVTVAELRKMAQARGLRHSGKNKSQLCAMLEIGSTAPLKPVSQCNKAELIQRIQRNQFSAGREVSATTVLQSKTCDTLRQYIEVSERQLENPYGCNNADFRSMYIEKAQRVGITVRSDIMKMSCDALEAEIRRLIEIEQKKVAIAAVLLSRVPKQANLSRTAEKNIFEAMIKKADLQQLKKWKKDKNWSPVREVSAKPKPLPRPPSAKPKPLPRPPLAKPKPPSTRPVPPPKPVSQCNKAELVDRLKLYQVAKLQSWDASMQKFFTKKTCEQLKDQVRNEADLAASWRVMVRSDVRSMSRKELLQAIGRLERALKMRPLTENQKRKMNDTKLRQEILVLTDQVWK